MAWRSKATEQCGLGEMMIPVTWETIREARGIMLRQCRASPMPSALHPVILTVLQFARMETFGRGGFNGTAALGIGNEDDQPLPVLVSGLTNVVALAGGFLHSIALLSDGTVKAWGDNYFGEIGDISSEIPTNVPGLSNIISIACGGSHNLFLNTNGNLFVWGSDFYGQLGDNGLDTSSDPIVVAVVKLQSAMDYTTRLPSGRLPNQ
jgi:alpha-tubulin suppressor-like RCC1 family protein